MADPDLEGPGDPPRGTPRDPDEFADPDAVEQVPAPAGPPGWLKPVAVLVAVGVAVGAALGYRGYRRQRVLQQGLGQARSLARADTYQGYQEAARLLEPLAKLDPLEAGSQRAFALAMLFADYREPRAAEEAEALLVGPGRAPQVPDAAQEAYAALALGRQEAGNASTFAARSQSPRGLTLRARTALLAGNLGAAAEPLARAIEVDPTFPAALALRGDVLRRSGQPAEAQRSYAEALAGSPLHPRAALGMGKLALSGQGDPVAARAALGRLLDDREATPRPERARAALHLASLQARAGDRAGAAAAVDKAGLDPGARAWLEKAVAEQELGRAGYRVVGGAPVALQSVSDDDPYLPPPPPPPRADPPAAPARQAVVAAPRKATSKKARAAAAKAKATAKAKKKAPPRKKPPVKAPPRKKAPAKKKAPPAE